MASAHPNAPAPEHAAAAAAAALTTAGALPRDAARYARLRGERLVRGEALLGAVAAQHAHARSAAEPLLDVRLAAASARGAHMEVAVSAATTLLAEVDRLRAVEAAHVALLEVAADAEAQGYDHDLRYPLVRVDPDAYLAWVGSCDAPTGWVMTLEEARAKGWPPMRIAVAREPDPDGYLFNRAGPGEVGLTVEALVEAYASAKAHQAFRLTPDKVQCARTSGRVDPVTGEWDDVTVFWSPWPPDAVPEALPAGWADRF